MCVCVCGFSISRPRVPRSPGLAADLFPGSASCPPILPWSVFKLPDKSGPQRNHGLPRWLIAKESACQCRSRRLDLGLGRFPWSRKWHPTPVSLPRKCHGQRSLVAYSPWGCKESDMTERRHTRKDLEFRKLNSRKI